MVCVPRFAKPGTKEPVTAFSVELAPEHTAGGVAVALEMTGNALTVITTWSVVVQPPSTAVTV